MLTTEIPQSCTKPYLTGRGEIPDSYFPITDSGFMKKFHLLIYKLCMLQNEKLLLHKILCVVFHQNFDAAVCQFQWNMGMWSWQKLLALISWQAISWANDDCVQWKTSYHDMASLGHDELKDSALKGWGIMDVNSMWPSESALVQETGISGMD